MNPHKFLAGGMASALIVVGLLLGGASPASAAQVWIQGVQRPSADAACPASTGPAPQSGWIVTDWTPSWEQWANGGTGGWTCTRSITWAKDSPAPTPPTVPDDEAEPEDPGDPSDPPESLCFVYISGSYWVSFASGNPIALPASILYQNSGCTGTAIEVSGTGYIVNAPDASAAGVLCGSGYTVADVPSSPDPVWFCLPS